MQEPISTAPHCPAVSIVVPIYKVEHYLQQCLDSILAQTLKDIEIILVDDGSPDACPAMVDEYAAKDARVIAIHQPNGGYGKAMNVGIARASGHYIGIVESDDWIEPDMYEKLLGRAEETGAELVKCGFYKYDSTQAPALQNVPWKPRYQDIEDYPDNVFTSAEHPYIHIFHPSLWSYLYRADFLKKFSFIETQGAAYQDTPFMANVLCKAHSIAVIKLYLYHYRMEQAQDSSSMVGDERMLRMLDVAAEILRIIEKEHISQPVREAIYFQVFSTNWLFCTSINPSLRKQYFNGLHELVARYMARPPFQCTYFPKRWKKRLCLCSRGNYTQFTLPLALKSLRKKIRTLFSK